MKFWKILMIVVGFWLGNAMLALLIIPDARVAIMPDGFEIGKLIMAIAFIIVGYGLLALGIILLVKGSKKKKSAKAYGASHKSSVKTSSYSGSTTSTPKPAPQKPNYPISSIDIEQQVKSASRVTIGFTNSYIEVEDVYAKEIGDFEFRIEVTLRAYGSVTIKDEVDASRYKSAAENAIKYMSNRIEEKVNQYYNRYGFGYEISITDVKDAVTYSQY